MADQQSIDPQDLERLLDEESDEDFGLPEFKEHLADTLTPAVLKDWTAKDFASIYVRFRPHLERHARRFLQNPSQVEEVVQDAFLYLMTTLPELDSELGVLKFLKWKTRLLALDVIRLNSKANLIPIEDEADFISDSPESSQALERADDAAVVSLALSKLQPRYREALIATLYEEKSQEIVAKQMGLTNNAFRQLLFRARAAFKKALVGEAETAGKRISEILSIAARKAASDAGRNLTVASAFLLVLALSLGLSQNRTPVSDNQISQPPQISEAPSASSREDELSSDLEISIESDLETVSAEPASDQEVIIAANQTTEDNPNSTATFGHEQLLGTKVISRLGSSPQAQATLVVSNQLNLYRLENGSGITAFLQIDRSAREPVVELEFRYKVGNIELVAIPESYGSTLEVLPDGSQVVKLAASSLQIFETQGKIQGQLPNDSILAQSISRLEIKLSQGAVPVEASISLSAGI